MTPSAPISVAATSAGSTGVSFALQNRLASDDLSITKTDGVTTAVPGGSVTYTIAVGNAGPDPSTATVSDTFPAVQTCTWTCVAAGGGSCTGSGSGNINDALVLPVGGSAVYTASCTIAASATGLMSNTANVSGPLHDSNPGNNSATDTHTLTPAPALGITKTDGVVSVFAGGHTTYTTNTTHAGPSNAPGSTVSDTLAQALVRELAGSGRSSALARLDLERENLFRAADWALSMRQWTQGASLVGALMPYWTARSLLMQGLDLAQAVLDIATPDEDRPLAAALCLDAASLAGRMGRLGQARALATRALDLATQAGKLDDEIQAQMLCAYCDVADGRGAAAVSSLEWILARSRRAGLKVQECDALSALGQARLQAGDFDAAYVETEKPRGFMRSWATRRARPSKPFPCRVGRAARRRSEGAAVDERGRSAEAAD